jgi:TetR/AcrR family transcriptional repressor of bet genes
MVNARSVTAADREVNRGAMPGRRRPEEERREAILEAAFQVAARDQLRGLSMRAVAEEAGVSKGLIFFHFRDKDTLLHALLDWLLEQSPRVEVPAEAEPEGMAPGRRLMLVLRHQIAVLPERKNRVELFLDFWVMGTGAPEIQTKIHRAFRRYRGEFLPFTRPVVESLPGRFDGEDGEGLAATIVSFIQGCALQLLSDPTGFDVERYMGAIRGLVVTTPE